MTRISCNTVFGRLVLELVGPRLIAAGVRQLISDQDVHRIAGKNKPGNTVVTVTGTETARMPGRNTAARKPRLPGATI